MSERGGGFGGMERFGDVEPSAELSPDWILDIVDEDRLAQAAEAPMCREWTKERLILEFLLGKIVEGGANLHPAHLARLRALYDGFVMLSFPNLRPEEQEFFAETYGAVPEYERVVEVTPDLAADVRFLYDTFSLQRPAAGEPISAELLQALDQGT